MRRYSILKKINKVYAVLLVAAIFSPLAFNIYFNVAKYDEEKLKLIKIASDFSSDKISEAYLLNNLVLVNQSLRGLCVELGLVSCELSDAKKNQIYLFKVKNDSLNDLATFKYPLTYNGKTLGWFNFKYQSGSFWKALFSSGIYALSWLTILMLLGAFFLHKLIKKPLEKFNDISIAMDGSNLSLIVKNIKNMNFSIDEVENLKLKIQNSLEKLRSYENISKEAEKLKAETNIARQVAHDIRSPLTALNVVSKDLTNLPEGSRVLLRSSIQRIQDIANNLVSKSDGYVNHQNMQQDILDSALLLPIIEEIVSEKRYQLRSKARVDVVLDGEQAYGLFAKVNEHTLKRIISNLIDNSVEAFESSGEVSIHISKHLSSNEVFLGIKDNGKGIPQDILPQLAHRGVSFGKEESQDSGSGLGLYHAKTHVEQWGGRFEIESEEGQGTVVKLSLPRAKAPEWFVPKINLNGIKTVLILDDDESIHQVWNKRLESYTNNHSIELKHARCPDAFRRELSNSNKEGLLCLCDYELIGYEETGLDLIESEQLQDYAILVTSRYAEGSVQERCKRLNIKLIPKTSADLVPLSLENDKILYDAVLIDDDEIVRSSWQVAAEDNKRVLLLEGPQDFYEVMHDIDPKTPIYIDQNLKNKKLGTDIVKDISKHGFEVLYLATGEEAYKIKQVHDVSLFIDIVGKTPPWV